MDSAKPNTTRLTTIIEKLTDGQVRFVLVGGLAAVAQGAPIATQDVDIVHERTEANILRLLQVLRDLDARYRRPGSEVLRPTREPLLTTGHSLFSTELGALDVLGSIEQGQTYDDLLPHTIELEICGKPVKVLRLEAMLENKRLSQHPKDRYVLAIIAETLAARQ